MSAIETTPDPAPAMEHNSLDEKFSEKGSRSRSASPAHDKEKIGHSVIAHGSEIDISDIGAVFDAPRLIDLGEDGKERPIGMVSLPNLL
jgi:hypothetical protein